MLWCRPVAVFLSWESLGLTTVLAVMMMLYSAIFPKRLNAQAASNTVIRKDDFWRVGYLNFMVNLERDKDKFRRCTE